MEVATRRYWRIWAGYQRLDRSSSSTKNQYRRIKIQKGSGKKKRFWRIRVVPKLKILKAASPKKLLICLRDAYVKMMLRLANSPAMTGSYAYGAHAVYDGVVGGFRGRPAKEYDEKTLVEIYKSIVMTSGGQLLQREAGKTAV